MAKSNTLALSDKRAGLLAKRSPEFVAELAGYEQAAAKLLQIPADTLCATPEEHARIDEAFEAVHRALTTVKAGRICEKHPHLQAGQDVDAVYMPTEKALEAAKEHLGRIKAQSLTAVVIAREVNEARAQQADASGDGAALVLASELNGELQSVDTNGLKLVWKPTEVDHALLPRKHMLVDWKGLDALGAATPSNLAPPDVPGVTWELVGKVRAKGNRK